jgi:hypothetical protein
MRTRRMGTILGAVATLGMVSASAAVSAQQASGSAAPGTPVEKSEAGAPAARSADIAAREREVSAVPLGPSGSVTDWLTVRGEFRGRFESVTGAAFTPATGDGYMLDRFRVDVIGTPARYVRFDVQLQDARSLDKTSGGAAVPYRDTADLRLAYADIGSRGLTVRAGRQELAFGEQRLIGHLNWVNDARSFDAVRVTVARKPFTFDAFAASVVTIQPEAFDRSGHGNWLYGFYGSSTAVIPKATVEPYILFRQSQGLALETGGVGDIRQATVGARWAGALPRGLDYGIEMALQTGSVGSESVGAWAGHWTIGRSFLGLRRKVRPFVEYNYATGDRDPKDGARGTFDQLYPTGHDKLGLADQVGWRNIEHARGGIEVKPAARWQVSGSYHDFWLASATDALYAASGAAVARMTSGAAGRHVGQEADLQAVYTYSSQLQIAAGYAQLLPGAFLTRTTPGSSYRYSYVMATYVFLGDKPGESNRQTRR